MDTSALFSPDRVYRYELRRTWQPELGHVAFIGLNPSTADESVDDPTIRRCIGFARTWGYGGIVMLNLFAFRATNPRVMRAALDPIGPENDAHILDAARSITTIVAAWGVHGSFRDRDRAVRNLIGGGLSALGHTKDWHPRHPLYVRADAVLVAA